MLNDMLADILKKALPPEVMEMLSSEKIKELGEQIKAAATNLRESLARIESNQLMYMNDSQAIILDKLAYLERKIDDYNSSDGAGKPKRARKLDPAGDGNTIIG